MNKTILFVDNSTRCFCIFRLPIAKAFVTKGYIVYVMSPGPYEHYLAQIESMGAKHIPYEISSGSSPFEDLKLLKLYYLQYKKIKPDYIVHYTIKPNIFGTLAAKLNSIPSLSVVPGTGAVFKRQGLVSKIVQLLYKIAFCFPQKVWVLNNDDYNAFINNHLISPQKIAILPGEGVDTSYFDSNLEYKKNDPFIFLYMGRMLREKGVEYIAKASQLLRDRGITNFEVHLLGLIDGLSKDVISMKEIETWERANLIRFLGSLPDVRKKIEISDCILLPTFYGEGVPRSLMEACAMKRSVLASDNVGCRDIIENGYNGLLCRAQDVEDLADKMEYMIALPEENLRMMGLNGRIKVENNFREEVIVRYYLNEIQLT